jgi:hypothetical protein
MNDPVDDVKAELSAAFRERAGEPASTPAEAMTQIIEIRGALTRDLDALRGRIPEPSEMAGQTKQIGAAAGIATAAMGVGAVVLRSRGKRKAEEEAVRVQAVALAREIARLELEPDEIVEDDPGGWIGKVTAVIALVAAIGGAVVAIRQRMAGDEDIWDAPV